MHIKPGIGKPRPVGQAIVNNLFGESAPAAYRWLA